MHNFVEQTINNHGGNPSHDGGMMYQPDEKVVEAVIDKLRSWSDHKARSEYQAAESLIQLIGPAIIDDGIRQRVAAMHPSERGFADMDGNAYLTENELLASLGVPPTSERA